MRAELEVILKTLQEESSSIDDVSKRKIQRREESVEEIRNLFDIDYLISRELRLILDDSSSLDEKIIELQKFNDQMKEFFS